MEKWIAGIALAVVIAPDAGKMLVGMVKRAVTRRVLSPYVAHEGATEAFAAELHDLGDAESHLDRLCKVDELGSWYPGEHVPAPPLIYFDTIMLTGDFDRMHEEVLCLA